MNHQQQTKQILISLKKSRGLLDKIIEMVEDKEYCINIMQQNMAALGLLKSVQHKLLDRHLHSCFKGAINSKNDKQKSKMIEEIIQVTRLTNK